MKRSKGKGKPTRNFSQRLQHNLKRQTVNQAQKAHLLKLSKKQSRGVKCDPFKKKKGENVSILARLVNLETDSGRDVKTQARSLHMKRIRSDTGSVALGSTHPSPQKPIRQIEDPSCLGMRWRNLDSD